MGVSSGEIMESREAGALVRAVTSVCGEEQAALWQDSLRCSHRLQVVFAGVAVAQVLRLACYAGTRVGRIVVQLQIRPCRGGGRLIYAGNGVPRDAS